MVDLVHFLTGGNQNTSADDHPVVKVTSWTPTSTTGKPWDMHTPFPCEMCDMNVKVGTCSRVDPPVNTFAPHGPSRVCELYAWKLMKEHQTVPAWLISALDSSESMGSVLSPNSTPAPPSHVQETDQPFGRSCPRTSPRRRRPPRSPCPSIRRGAWRWIPGTSAQRTLGRASTATNRGTGQATPTGAGSTVRYAISGFSTSQDKDPRVCLPWCPTTRWSTGPWWNYNNSYHCPDLQRHVGQAGSRGETPGDDPQGQGSAGLLHEQDKSTSAPTTRNLQRQPQGTLLRARQWRAVTVGRNLSWTRWTSSGTAPRRSRPNLWKWSPNVSKQSRIKSPRRRELQEVA